MKTVQDIFRTNQEAKEIPVVEILIAEYEAVCDQLIDLQQKTEMSKEKYFKILVREIRDSITAELKRDDEALRFKETDRVNFKTSMKNLERYIQQWCKDYRVYL